MAVELGTVHSVDEIALGSEHTASFNDRLLGAFEVDVAAVQNPRDSDWHKVFEYQGPPFSVTRQFRFGATAARHVRVTILNSQAGPCRIDELEIYEAQPGADGGEPARRDPPKVAAAAPIPFWEVCTQNAAWQKEKLNRILNITKQGVDFMMFDEFDWRGPCHHPGHGHAIPSTPEGHVLAVYGLIESVRKVCPDLLVEAHDPVWPWVTRYLPTYFRQGFGQHRYQENWGFEFMWNPIEDLKSGRALCLYYYNLGCDIPLYDHITMEADNDNCLSFWWYASTVRHLGIGGKKGLNSAKENPARFAAYQKAVARYHSFRSCFTRGRFVGLDETSHLHVDPSGKTIVLLLFNLTDAPQTREVQLSPALLGWKNIHEAAVDGAEARRAGESLVINANLQAMSPAVIGIHRERSSPRIRP